MEKFRNRLAQWLALNIMHKYENIPATLDEWKTATKKEILRRAQIKAEMPSRNNSGIPYPGKPFQKLNLPRTNVATGSSQPHYVPMDVDIARLGGPLMPEERKLLMEENRCFYCRDKGHRFARCWKKPNNQRQTNVPSSAQKEMNPFPIRAATMEQSQAPPTDAPDTTPWDVTMSHFLLFGIDNLSMLSLVAYFV